MTSELALPDFGLNGSGALNLFRDAAQVCHDLRTALGSMRAMTPHGRDFQNSGEVEFMKARHQHDSRMQRLRDALEEVGAIATEASKQHGAC